ncbi:hypothetical protein JCM10207_002257 [Rhodosporidiobolus poonsookiae]
MFSTLARGYNSLATASTPQSATGTIDKLCDRLLNAQQLEDRKAALLGLKGLSRDWKSDVGSRALPILLGVLEEDATQDVEMAKAVVETLSLLCEVEEVDGRPVRDDSGVRNTDVFLTTPTPLHTLLTLLTPMHFYLRFFTLQLLGILLANRPAQVQQYVLTAAGGVGRLVETLDDTREIIRNESLLLLIALTTQNADIQKLLAFEGAFDKLFTIVRNEGGIGSGGIVVQDCLAAVGGLLRWNVSNQNYFRETTCIPLLAPLLLFPRPNALTPQSLATFAFQSWSEQKVINAGLVISLVRMLVGGAGSGRAANQKALLQTGLTRCLIELALASNAPAVLKSQSLNALADILRLSPDNQNLLTSLIVTPLIPPLAPSSPETYGEDAAHHDHSEHDPHGHHHHAGREHEHAEPPRPSANKWRRGAPVAAVVAVVNLAVNGDGTPGREGLRVRASAASTFENYVAGANETQLGILSTMSTPQPDAIDGETGERIDSAGSILLRALRQFPTATRNEPFDSYVPFFACLLFSHLLLSSEISKTLARKIYFQGDDTEPGGFGDEDDRTSLVAILVGNLMMAQREQAQSANAGLGPERGLEWSRVMVGYLTVLSVWLWESPATVKEFLSEGSNLQVLLQPITQSSGVDSVVQGLCAFLLGICYEYNREPGPITRDTLHPILQSRVGPDQFVSRILRLREDPRFRNVGPTTLELIDDDDTVADELGEEEGLWFDFAFVEFLKTNYISVQRAILVDPNATTSNTRSIGEGSTEMLATMRSTITDQSKELDELRELVHELQAEREAERATFQHEVASLSDTIVSMREQINTLRLEKEEADREQEDLLVLLEDLSAKRREDKRKLREKGVEVSEDEDEEDDEEEEPSAIAVQDDGSAPPSVNGDERPKSAASSVALNVASVRQPTPPPPPPVAAPPAPAPAAPLPAPSPVPPPPQQEKPQPAMNGRFAPPTRSYSPYAPPSLSAPVDLYAPPPQSAAPAVEEDARDEVEVKEEPIPEELPEPAQEVDEPRHEPFAVKDEPEEPRRDIFAHKPFGVDLSFGFFAPKKQSLDLRPSSAQSQRSQPAQREPVAPPPRKRDSFVPPPPHSRQQSEQQRRDPFAPPPPAAAAAQSDPFPPAQHDPFASKPDARESFASQADAHDPFALKADVHDPFAPSKQAVHDPYAPTSTDRPHDPFAAPAANEQVHDPFASKEERHDPFAPKEAAKDPFAPVKQEAHDPFAPKEPAHDPFAPPKGGAYDPFAPKEASHDPFAASKQPEHDPFAPPKSQHDPFSAKPHDPFAPKPHDRAPSHPFGLSASQQQDDPYSPFGGPHVNNDPFGLASSAHSSAGGDPYSPFGAPAASSQGQQPSWAQHNHTSSHRDVSDLFK